MGYVVSRGGTFGVVKRIYDGGKNVLIRWGPLGWITPVAYSDVKFLKSNYECEARKEAEEWLKSIGVIK